LSEIGTQLKSHTNRRNEHQSQIKSALDNLQQQMNYFGSLEDIQNSEDKWKWFNDKISGLEKELHTTQMRNSSMSNQDIVQRKEIAELQNQKNENDDLMKENRRLKDEYEKVFNS